MVQLERVISNSIKREIFNGECSINQSYQNLLVFVPYLCFHVGGVCRHQLAMWRWQVGRVGLVGNRLDGKGGVKGKARGMTLVSVLDRVCPWK